MTLAMALEILNLATSLVSSISGVTSDPEGIQQIITSLIKAVAQAYREQVGKPIDPSLIKAEVSI